MAILHFIGMETGDLKEWALDPIGGCTVDATVFHKGAYSLKITSADGAQTNYCTLKTLSASGGTSDDLTVATAWGTFFFRVGVIPNLAAAPVLRAQAVNGDTKVELRLNTAGKLDLYNRAQVLHASGTTVLSTNTWYRIDLKVGTESAAPANDAVYELRINGVTEYSGSNLDGSNSVNRWWHFGNDNVRTSGAFTFYYDDIVIDSTAYHENYRIVALRPNADGFHNDDWDDGGVAPFYDNVDDLPSDADATYIRYVPGGGSKKYSVNLEPSTAAGISASAAIYAVKSTIYARRAGGAVTIEVQFFGRSASTDFVTVGSFTCSSTDYDPGGQLWLTDPGTATAWTAAGLDAFEVGLLAGGNYALDTCRCTTMVVSILTDDVEGNMVRHNAAIGNLCLENSLNGISVTLPTNVAKTPVIDQLLLKGNLCVENSVGSTGSGILLGQDDDETGGNNSVVSSNVCMRNGSVGIKLEVTTGDALQYVSVLGNCCSEDQPSADQATGIFLDGPVQSCVMLGNIVHGNATAQINDASDDPTLNVKGHNILE